MLWTRRVDHRLLGTWRSDAMLTLSEWVFAEGTSDRAKASLTSRFDKLIVRYTAEQVFTEFEGDQTVCSYRVIAIDPSSVAIVRRTDDGNEIQHIHFTEPSVLWVSAGRNREFFRRVKT